MKIPRILLALALFAAPAFGQGTFNTLLVTGNVTFSGLNGVLLSHGSSGNMTATTIGGIGGLAIANNLSDLANPATSRGNLGLGSAATQATSAFDAAGSASTAQSNAETYTLNNALFKSNNLSDLTNPATARNNLSLGSSTTASFAGLNLGGNGLVNAGMMTLGPVAYTAGGTNTLRFDLGGYAQLPLASDVAFTYAGTNQAGSMQIIDFSNPSGSVRALSWPSGIVWPFGGAPSSILNGDAFRVMLISSGTSAASITGIVTGTNLPYLDATELQAGINGFTDLGNLVTVPVPYTAGGTQNLRFDLGAYGNMGLTADSNFVGAFGMQAGATQTLDITNPSGSTRNLAWPSGIVWGPSAAPSTIPNGGFIRVWFMCTNGATSGIRAFYVASGGGGGGVTQLVAGAGISLAPSGGTGTVTVTATGTPAITVFNVAAYGAVPNNSGAAGSNTTAVLATVAAMEANGGGTVYFPDGIWYLNAVIPISTTYNFTIKGNGSPSSLIYQNATNTGVFAITEGQRDMWCEIEGLTLSNNSGPDSTAAAIAVSNSSVSYVGMYNFLAHDVDIISPPGSQAAFQYGYEISGLWLSNIRQSVYNGDPTTHYGTGILWQNDAPGISIELNVVDFQVYDALAGATILNDGTTDGIQGAHFTNVNIVGAENGVTSDGITLFQMENCEFNCSNYAIYGTGTHGGLDQLECTNCNFYMAPSTTTVTGVGMTRATMTGCTFIGGSTTTTNAIVFDGSSYTNSVSNCVFLWCGGYCVQCATGSTQNLVHDNISSLNIGNSGTFTDNGTSNYFHDNH